MKKQVFGMIAALIALTVMLLTGAYAAEAPANAESAAPDADAETETETAELSAADAYAILYEDGTLVFQTSETPETGRAVKKTYPVDLTAVYTYDGDNYRATTPWFNECGSIHFVNFAEKISPTSTACWFCDCFNLERVDNISNLGTASVTDMSYMFFYCRKLTVLDLSHFDTANVTRMDYMFYVCESLTAVNVSHFDTSNVMDMSYMFGGCINLVELDVSHFDTTNVKDMAYMFFDCSKLTALDVSYFNTANVTNMWCMFFGCKGLVELDVSHFDTANVTNMSHMFKDCRALTALDVSHFNTTNVENMGGMFDCCWSVTALDVSQFDTAKVTDMGGMFDYCSGLTALDVSKFDTAKVMSMYGMFGSCSGLTVLDLSNFNTANVTNMRIMFNSCSNLKTIFVSEKFTTASVGYDADMFSGCASLVGGNGTEYDENHTDKEYARIDTEDAKGYFTYKATPAPVKYAIADAVIKDGTLSVTLTNPDAVTLAVSYFDSDGKFLSAESQSVGANVGAASLALSADAKTFCVMLCDTDWRPLCAPYPATL